MTYDPLDANLHEKIKDRNKNHVKQTHFDFTGTFQIHQIYYQNGHEPGLQFELHLGTSGYLTITRVTGSLDINVGDILSQNWTSSNEYGFATIFSDG